MTSRTTDKRCDALASDPEIRGPIASAPLVATSRQEMENEKSFSSLLGLQYPRSPLPNNRTANALVLIDGSLQCESLSGVLLKENLRLIRLVKTVDSCSTSTASSAILTHDATNFNFAEPQFVATIIVDDADMFRVHIAEPVSTSMSNCDAKLVEYFRSLVMTLVSRITGRLMTVVKETFSGERWHTCVPCLMECPNIQSFLHHALSIHDLKLPKELNLPTTCQSVSFGPLLILQSESQNQLHILRTLVSLKLTSCDAPTTSPSQDARPASPVAGTRPSAELLRVMADLIKGIHCESHTHFVPTCPDCHELLSAKLGRTKELAPFLACLPDLVAITQTNAAAAESVLPDSSTISVNNMRINSKTLKCPMCNWTYKYRETLEQHLRDKHPDVLLGSPEMDPTVVRRSCLYCQSGVQHPKLSKGEVYPCGYAAYHCHYCGYKTNTKGNLEIHKQSEKHLMNVQKHGRVQGLPVLPQQRPKPFLGDYPASSPQFVANQLLDQQMKHQMAVNQLPSQSECDRIVPTEFNGTTDFLRCFVCGTFSTGSLKDLIDHVNHPRDVGEEEYILRGADPQPFVFCKLCPYKTYVKANFSVHCNTEKHRQKVGLLAHIYAGDRRRIEGIEWPARLSNMSPVQILCTACQSIHTSLASVERHLQSENHIDAFNTLVYVSDCTQELFDQKLSEAEFVFECRLCAKKMSNVSDLRSHMISSEHFVKISATVPRHCYTKPEILKNILNVSLDSKSQSFNLKESASTTRLQCPCCSEHLPDSQDLKAHLIKAHFIDESRVDTMCQMATEVKYPTPVCDAADVAEEGLRENIKITNIGDDFSDAFISEHSANELIYTCDVCYKDIAGATALFEHLSQMNHFESNNADTAKLLCWKKGCNQYFSSHTAREKHLRKIHMHQQAENSIYRLQCPFCGLAFRMEETFNRHIILHQTLLKYYGSHACTICHTQIQSSSDLRLHVFKTHSGLNNRLKEKVGPDDSSTEHAVCALDAKSPPTMPHRKASSPDGNHTSPQQNPNTLTCIFCHTRHPTIAEFRAHEQSMEHYQRINAFILNLYNARAASTGAMMPLPLPLGMTNANQMTTFLSSISGPGSIISPHGVPLVAHVNTPTRHVDETSSESLPHDAESPTALQIVTQRAKASPNESDRQTSPAVSPSAGIAREENPGSSYLPPVAQIPPSTPNSGSSSSSLPTSSQPGLISPSPILPGILSPLGLTAHNFPGQTNFNPVLVSRTKPTPSPVTPHEGGKRRGRTRISEEQLQILRQHFHINSPPSDSLIREISVKTGLDLKVIKHWYRNTLFKERQRDKDNPYNFSVPPSTSLNLEEYEKTGRIEVRTAQNESEAGDNPVSNQNHVHVSERCAEANENNESATKTDTSDVSCNQRRKRPLEENSRDEENKDVNHNQDQFTKRARLASPIRTDAPKLTEENLTMYQLDSLMSSYKKNSFPSEDHVSQLASEIGLSEERVLNWFSKARADDCSNLNMLADVAGVAEAEAIVAVRCPYCQIIFRLRSQLANHLQSAHPDKPRVDAESLPDGSVCLGMSNSIDARPWLSSVHQGNEGVPPNFMTAANPAHQQTQRRVRTSITSVQSALLRYIYSQNKNPGVSESKKLSEKLSLSRRVVQVWFQNQRAQEKKRSRGSRLSISNMDRPGSPNGDSNDWLPMDTKVLCSSCIIGEADESHIFSDDHLDAICSYVEARIAESSNC